MKIEILREVDFGKLEGKIRKVPLINKQEDGSDIYVYADANISLREFNVVEVNPTSFYLIKENMQKQRDLREALLEKGIDILHLDRGYELENEDGEIWTLMPPVIEVTPRIVNYVCQEGN